MDPETGAMTITEFMNNGFIFAILLLFLIPGAHTVSRSVKLKIHLI